MLGEEIQIGRSKSYSPLFLISTEIRSILILYIAHELFTTQGYIKITNIKEMAIQNPDSLVFNIKNFNVWNYLQKPNPT